MSALPPVRTGGKKPPAAGATPRKTPAAAGTGGAAAPAKAGPSAPPAEDTKARVAREREERMAAVKSAKAEQQRPAPAGGAGANGGAAPPSAPTSAGSNTARSKAEPPAAKAPAAAGAKKTPPASARAAPASAATLAKKEAAAPKAPPAKAAGKAKATPAAPPAAAAPPKKSPRRPSQASDAPKTPPTGAPAKASPRKAAPAAPTDGGNGGKSKAAPAPPAAGAPKRKAPAPEAPAAAAAAAAPAPAPAEEKPAVSAAPAAATAAPAAEAAPPSKADAAAGAAGEDPPLKSPAEHFKLDGPVGVDVTSELTKNLVYECFPGDGLCFRVVDRTGPQPRWLFYNDTEDMEIQAEVTFNKGSSVKALGSAVLKEIDGGKILITDAVRPGATQEFMVGKSTGHACSFAADEVSAETKTELLAAASASLESELVIVERAVKKAGVDPANEEAVLALCGKENIGYVDLNFRPGPSCFFREGKDEPIDIFAMLRPTQYLPEAQRKTIALINTVEPNDIDQGMLGDCWFLCAISSLAEFPEKCHDLFEHPVSVDAGKKERALGAYRVAMLHNGWWQNVIIDDFLPTQGGRACFARNIEDPGELWVSLLEKAYAKVRGSYSVIIGGDPLHALEDLTGYPTTRLDRKFSLAFDDEAASDALFLDLLRYDESGYLVTVGTPTPNPDDEEETKELETKYDEAGLTVDHSYSVIVVKHYPAKGIKLLKIRNPWGNEREWEGAWGDNSPEWKEHPEIAKDCEFDGPSSDGTFWMQWSDALEYFDTGGVCFMSNDWHDCRTRGRIESGVPSVALKITCRRKCKAFLVLNQAPEPGFDPAKPDAKYAGAMVSVWRRDVATGAYKVHLNSTSDFDAPKPDFTFLVGRSVGLLYTFEPMDEPYFVVPRGFSAAVDKDYCFGMISDETVGTADRHALKVEFVKLDASLKAFENFDTFAMDPATQATVIAAEYQVNPEVGAPYTDKGESIVIRPPVEASA